MKRSTYIVDLSRLKHAFGVLQKEKETLSPWERRLFASLNFVVYAALIAFTLLILQHLLIDQSKYGDVFTVLVLASAFFLASALVLFVFNIRVFNTILTQERQVHRLGLSKDLRAPWEAERRENRVRNYVTLAVPFLWLGFGILGFQQGWLADLSGSDWISPAIVVALFGLTLLVMHFSRRGKERLDVINRLQKSLPKLTEQGEEEDESPIQIDPDTYKQIEQIERAQFTRDLAEHLAAYQKQPDTDIYTVLKNQAVLESQKDLKDIDRIYVENQIEELMMDPHPPEATEDPETQTQRVPVPGTSIEIRYEVVEAEKRIIIHSLKY